TVHDLAWGIEAGSDVFADVLRDIPGQFGAVTGSTTVVVQVVEEVAVGHVARVAVGRAGQGIVPRQRRGRAERLGAALVWFGARGVDQVQQLLAFGLPVAQATGQQRAGQHDAPILAAIADADVDILR